MKKQLVDFTGLKIKLASPETIRSWSYGEVAKPETINYRTLKPEKDGLFCERIFGPTKDYECYCGKYKKARYRGIVCDKCGVEVTQSRVRRERMGHITLASPVVHVWFFKGASSKLSSLLDISPKELESVVYFARYLVTAVEQQEKKKVLSRLEEDMKGKKEKLKQAMATSVEDFKKQGKEDGERVKKKINNREQKTLALREIELRLKQKIQGARDKLVLEEERAEEIYRVISGMIRSLKEFSLLTEDEYLKLSDYNATSFFQVGMGAEVLLEAAKKINLEQLTALLRKEIQESRGVRYVKATKRFRLAEGMRKAGIDPSWIILQVLPVIPPDLRPMVQLSGGRFAASDLNDLYRRVINRNNRLKHLMNLGAPEIILRNEKRMLQESVDNLIDGSKKIGVRSRRRTRQLRSLSDMLRGKQGRFRQNLLGKRVDYSGRSVIVVGPELKLNQCGIPKDMALEMFKPFVLRELIKSGIAPNVKSAKYILERRPPEVFDILEDITHDHPVLLNRAPTLHKLGIQAFYPILIEGAAIRVHPCVCRGFNADFDGDQMAVHVPLCQRAKKEALELMSADKNLIKPADGSPINVPDKEMTLGCYFITSINFQIDSYQGIFADSKEAILAYQHDIIELRQRLKVRKDGKMIETTVGRLLFNEILPKEIAFLNSEIKEFTIRSLITRAMQVCAREKVVQFIDNLKEIGFWGSTISGLSVGIWDCEISPEKTKIIDSANKRVAQVEDTVSQGLITVQEKRRLTQEIWMETTEELTDKTWDRFSPENSIRLIVNAGVRRMSKDQVKQLSAMRGLVVDPLGKIVELPTKSNFREGLSVFEYVTSTRGSRKGLTDTAIKTSDAGYLTRRLVDVAHDVIVRTQDCKTERGLKIACVGKRKEKFLFRSLGRVLAKKVTDPKTKRVLLKRGEVVTEANMALLESNAVREIWVRSPLTCMAKYGVCAVCYGWDLSTRQLVDIGAPVGVIAAQSIGEPGTQLTLRTKHFGGIVVSDVTQGLPRVEELFEARTPKVLSPLSEIAGKVNVTETDIGHKIEIKSIGVKPIEKREYFVPAVVQLRVETGDLVDAGAQLTSGSLDIKEVLEVRGLLSAQEYLIEEIQLVYESQGIPINDRHFEIVVRKMSDKVRIETAGDTVFLPGELIEGVRFAGENARVLAEGGSPATAQVIILGITRASLQTESWLSAASFQTTTGVLADAAVEGKEDNLLGLKENVIIGRLIPVTPERAKIEE